MAKIPTTFINPAVSTVFNTRLNALEAGKLRLLAYEEKKTVSEIVRIAVEHFVNLGPDEKKM